MQVELIIRNADLGKMLRNYADRRLHFALSRFGDRVDGVLVTVSDSTDTQRPSEKHCSIRVEVKPFGQVFAEETDPDVYVAIDRAAGRVGRLLASRLERNTETPRAASRPERRKPGGKRRRTPSRTPFRSFRRLRAEFLAES
ncbi:MAG TPA: HPF/RaiA family ribosome-associated protein [Candidatus Sulfotelmatobacter sp.]|nr:HPF/RaiA family ribosome-associated protein [Candidatus Sulfotelmatobacter sp.]